MLLLPLFLMSERRSSGWLSPVPLQNVSLCVCCTYPPVYRRLSLRAYLLSSSLLSSLPFWTEGIHCRLCSFLDSHHPEKLVSGVRNGGDAVFLKPPRIHVFFLPLFELYIRNSVMTSLWASFYSVLNHGGKLSQIVGCFLLLFVCFSPFL